MPPCSLPHCLLLSRATAYIDYTNQDLRDFPGSLVFQTSFSSARDVDLIPGRGTKIPHALRPKKKQIIKNRSNIETSSIKTLKMVQIKKSSKRIK